MWVLFAAPGSAAAAAAAAAAAQGNEADLHQFLERRDHRVTGHIMPAQAGIALVQCQTSGTTAHANPSFFRDW